MSSDRSFYLEFLENQNTDFYIDSLSIDSQVVFDKFSELSHIVDEKLSDYGIDHSVSDVGNCTISQSGLFKKKKEGKYFTVDLKKDGYFGVTFVCVYNNPFIVYVKTNGCSKNFEKEDKMERRKSEGKLFVGSGADKLELRTEIEYYGKISGILLEALSDFGINIE